MAKKKTTRQLAHTFQRQMQKIVDDGKNITSISIEVEGRKYTIAEKDKTNGKAKSSS